MIPSCLSISCLCTMYLKTSLRLCVFEVLPSHSSAAAAAAAAGDSGADEDGDEDNAICTLCKPREELSRGSVMKNIEKTEIH